MLKQECPGIETIAIDLAGWTETRTALKDVPLLDGLVNNAAVVVEAKSFLKFTEQEFDVISNVNFKSVFNLCQFLEPKLKDGASIVNVSSLGSKKAFSGMVFLLFTGKTC